MDQRTDRPVVLITGSSGLLGTAITAALLPDHHVVGLDVKAPESTPEGLDHVFCDLTDEESVKKAVGEVAARFGPRLASVIHLAAYYDFSGEPSPLYQELTVEGARRLARQLKLLQVEQLVFSSTLLVMEPAAPGEVITEESPLQAEWAYPRSKVEAERVLESEHGDVPLVVLRIAGVYDDDGHSLPIGQQIARIHEKQLESIVFPGNPGHGQPFVHLHDVAECFRRVVELRQELGKHEVFLVAEPETPTYEQLQDIIGKAIHGRAWPTIRIPAPVAKAGAWAKEHGPGGGDQFIKPWMIDLADAHYPVSVARARERLGWEPRHRLTRRLPVILERFKADPEGWKARNGLAAE